MPDRKWILYPPEKSRSHQSLQKWNNIKFSKMVEWNRYKKFPTVRGTGRKKNFPTVRCTAQPQKNEVWEENFFLSPVRCSKLELAWESAQLIETSYALFRYTRLMGFILDVTSRVEAYDVSIQWTHSYVTRSNVLIL